MDEVMSRTSMEVWKYGRLEVTCKLDSDYPMGNAAHPATVFAFLTIGQVFFSKQI
jgi:hypothetical protein